MVCQFCNHYFSWESFVKYNQNQIASNNWFWHCFKCYLTAVSSGAFWNINNTRFFNKMCSFLISCRKKLARRLLFDKSANDTKFMYSKSMWDKVSVQGDLFKTYHSFIFKIRDWILKLNIVFLFIFFVCFTILW